MSNAIFGGKTDIRTLTIDELRSLVRRADAQNETLWTGHGVEPGEMDAQAVLDVMVAADNAGFEDAESFVGQSAHGHAAWKRAQKRALIRYKRRLEAQS